MGKGVRPLSLSICDQTSKIPFRCKGNWISLEHYVIPTVPMRKNENYGYCKICWEIGFKDNIGGANPENMTKKASFSDSKINPNSGPCGNDTL